MESPGKIIFSFVIVCVVSSFCVAIGIGGGILYVPLLGFLYSNVTKGVYLSKASILMTSFIGTSYHLWNDVAVVVKAYRKKRASKKPDSDGKKDKTETVLSKFRLTDGANTLGTPRIHLVLSLSLIPFCILGSFLGTTFHFFAQNYIKLVVTVIVSLCLVVTIIKLIMLVVNRKKNSGEGSDYVVTDCLSNPYKNEVSSENDRSGVESGNDAGNRNEMESRDVRVTYDDEDVEGRNGVVARIDSGQSVINGINKLFRSYNNVTVHTVDKRIVSFILIVFCLLMYYMAIKVDNIFLYPPVFVLMLSLGLFYALKTRLSFKRGKIDETYSKGLGKVRDKVYKKMGPKKASKFLEAGVHYILLNLVVAFLSGFFSGSAGTGSGIFMVPLLQYLAMNPVSCTATSNFLTLSMCIATLSRFGLKVNFKPEEILPPLFGSLVGTSMSLFLIRTITRDRISAYFVNATLVVFCISSIVLTWTI